MIYPEENREEGIGMEQEKTGLAVQEETSPVSAAQSAPEDPEPKSEEEKKAMAEKRRFKQNREFKKRLDEEEENEEGDIRSFKFHKHHPAFKEPRGLGQDRDFSDGERPTGRDRRAARARGEFKKDRRGNSRDFKGGKGDFKGGRRDFKGGKRGDFKRGGRDFKNTGNDFSDED